MKVWLDDTRLPPDASWTHIKTAEEAIILAYSGIVEEISFDYDLGTELNGQDVAKEFLFLCERGLLPRMPRWSTHSQDPIKKDKIAFVMEEAQERFVHHKELG